MEMNSNENKINDVVQLIKPSKNIVFFSGAGISTASGIPDFRSRTDGLWNRFDPMLTASLTTFKEQPDKFYDWFRPLAKKIWYAHPNIAHMSISKLEEAGFDNTVITQNIDGLHQKSGSTIVYELHGNIQQLECIYCNQSFNTTIFIKGFLADNVLPLCPNCGGILKPKIVLFEEILPCEEWDKAYAASLHADIFIVVGSSLEVSPANSLLLTAKRSGATIVIINNSPTKFDECASIVISRPLEIVLPKIAEQIVN